MVVCFIDIVETVDHRCYQILFYFTVVIETTSTDAITTGESI